MGPFYKSLMLLGLIKDDGLEGTVFWGGAVGHSTQNQQLKESSYVPISKLWTRKTDTLCSKMP